ncbi:MAG: hypothetical protein AB1679_30740 [Actinomycetota bacterium]
MTRRTTRIAALGAGLLAFGLFSAAPAGAADGAQANAEISADATNAINQTLALVNQACTEAGELGDAAASTLASEQGITVAASPAGSDLNLQVSLPALTDSLGSLPLLGSLTGQVDATAPLTISCATAADGTGLGLSAAGVDVLVNAIAPGIDVSSLGIDVPAVDVNAAATAAPAAPGSAAVSATAAGSVPTTARANVSSSSVRASAAAPAPATTTTTSASARPASASASGSGGIVDQTVGSPGALARTGAGVGALGLLGTALFGSGRLFALGRKLLGG